MQEVGGTHLVGWDGGTPYDVLGLLVTYSINSLFQTL